MAHPEVEEYRGVPLLIWDGDFEMDSDRRLIPPVYDELGQGARLAFLEGIILYTLWTDGLRAMIDALNDTSCGCRGLRPPGPRAG